MQSKFIWRRYRLREIYKDQGSSDIVSFTVNKYAYSVVKENTDNYKIYDEKYRLNYFNSESIKDKKI